MSSADAQPAKLLLSGPAGCGKTHAALAAIRAAATTPGPRGRAAAQPGEALLVLPTYAQVMHVKRLALSRWDVRGLLDQPFTTFTAAGERFLPAFQVRGLPSAEERDRLMEEALRQRDVPLFREIVDRPGFRAHLLRLVKELKQTGLEGGEAREHLQASRGVVSTTSRAKLDGFLTVFECYEDLLERAGMEDHEDALRRLALRLEEEPPAEPPRLLVVDGFDDFSRIEERILAALSDRVVAKGGRVLVTLPWDDQRPLLFAATQGARERLLRSGFEEQQLAGFPRSTSEPLAAIAGHLFGAPTEPMPGGASVQSYVAGDAEDEAETVARAVRHVVERERPEGLRGWRDVGVVVRRLDAHAPRLEAAFARLRVPLRVVGSGDVLASEPLVRALRGPLAVLAGETDAGRFEAGPVMEWLRWRALVTADVDPREVDAWDIEQRKHGFAHDFATLHAAASGSLIAPLDVLAAVASRLAQAAEPAARYEALAHAIEELAPLPEPSGFTVDGHPVDGAHDERLARAVAGRARLVGVVHALAAAIRRTELGGAPDAARAVGELTDALEHTTLRPADRRLDAVTLMDAEEARFWDLPVFVVAGLEEGGFPLRPREDVLLRDADREALRKEDTALRLPLAREREARERRLFYGALTRAGERLLLVRRAYDDKGDPKECSLYVRELESVVTPTPVQQARSPGRVAREASECFTRSDWLLHAAARRGPWSAERRDVPPEERALAAAIQLTAGTTAPARVVRQRRRTSDELWRDGAERDAVLAQFSGATELVSVSRLNHAVLCPQRFFLAYVAQVPQDDLTLDGPAFDVRDMGKALHHAFEQALRHPEREPADLARAGVAHVGAQGLEARLLEGELERVVTLLRDREHRTVGPLTPWTDGLELSFGTDGTLAIGPDDARLALQGYVDRIDRAVLPDGSEVAAIIDYKRSATSAGSSYKNALAGRDLQVPLYARALEELLGVRVVGFEWLGGLTRERRILHDADHEALFAGRREANLPKAEEHDVFRTRITDAERLAADVVRRARRGDHARAPSVAGTCLGTKDQHPCPWLSVCRPDAAHLDERLLAGEDAS